MISLKLRAGGPKAEKRLGPERATYQLTLNTLRFACHSGCYATLGPAARSAVGDKSAQPCFMKDANRLKGEAVLSGKGKTLRARFAAASRLTNLPRAVSLSA